MNNTLILSIHVFVDVIIIEWTQSMFLYLYSQVKLEPGDEKTHHTLSKKKLRDPGLCLIPCHVVVQVRGIQILSHQGQTWGRWRKRPRKLFTNMYPSCQKKKNWLMRALSVDSLNGGFFTWGFSAVGRSARKKSSLWVCDGIALMKHS